MQRSVSVAQRELRELMQRDLTLRFPPQGALADTPLRHSAVLILFGALDRTPARDSASRVPPELDVLLTRRADRMRHHAGQIAFPGGGVEDGDADAAATALREAHEETGLDPDGVEVLGTLPDVHIPVSNNLVTPVVGWWQLPSEVAADHTESVEVFRTPVADLLNPAARGTSVINRSGFNYRGAAFRLGPQFGTHTVWGFTGILLATMFDELGWSDEWDPRQEFPVNP